MASLGDFSAALAELDPDAEKDTFTFFGEEFEVAGPIPTMLAMQLGASATGKISEAEGLAAMWESLRCSLTVPAHTGEDGTEVPENDSAFTRFYQTAVAKRADPPTLMRLVFKLFEVQGGRPTQAAPDFSPGPQSTSPSSRSLSTHPEYAHLRPVSEVLAG